MTDRITRWLDESQRLADQATAGPWAWSAAAHGDPTGGPTYHAVRARGGVVAETDYELHGALDAEFIAESRTRFPQAVAALREVSELHEPFWLYAHEDACENETEDHQQEHHVESDVGEYYCDTMPLYQVCSACLDGYGNHDVEYPCETRRLAEAALGLGGDGDEQ